MPRRPRERNLVYLDGGCRTTQLVRDSFLTAEARQTEICTYLSAILLGGLLLNAVFGWWWADPVAALVMYR